MMSPDAIPGYRIERELGRGGMAVVYLALQESLGREVALKLLNARYATEPGFSERFLREGRIAAGLHHRHIIAVHDIGSHQGNLYLAMEYLPKGSIAAAAGQMSVVDVLRCVREIAWALDTAHRQGVVHRDVKPENILLHEDGAFVLSDFGVAHLLGSHSVMTSEGATVGTPAYMSPEQWRSHALDGRSDLYSLGVVFYQLLTGEVPYSGTDGWALGMQHMSAPVPELLPRHRHLQPLLDALMAKEPAQRPACAADVVQRVAALEDEARRGGPHPTLPPLARDGAARARPSASARATASSRPGWFARVQGPWRLALGGTVSLAVIIGAAAWLSPRPPSESTALLAVEAEPDAPVSADVAAYREYLAGSRLLTRLDPDELRAAFTHFERAIELDPRYARAYAAAATTLGLLRDYASVEERVYRRRAGYVERALELAPELGEAHTASGDLLEDSGDYEAAERAYLRGIELAPGGAIGYERYGRLLLYRKGDADGAVARLERAAALDSGSPAILSAYGRALLELGREDEAADVLGRIERDWPDFVSTYIHRARLEAQRGDLVAALRASARAVALQPDSERPLRQYCNLLSDFGALPAAERCLGRFEQRFGVSDDSREARADLAIRRGEFGQALAHLQESSLSLRSGWSYAELLDLNGEPQRALSIYRELAPELLREPLGQPAISDPVDAVLVGAALRHAGSITQAEALLRHALAQVATRQRYAGLTGRRWSEVFLHALLGDPERACAAMQRGLDAGYFFDYRLLESDPDLAVLRTQPCFAAPFARIRALAEAQVQRADQAGLLDPE